MPRGNGTGPAGKGPMTGRRLGHCAGWDEPGFVNDDRSPRGGRGFGRGRERGGGRGFGRGNGYGFGPGRSFDPAPAWTPPQVRGDEQQPLAAQIARLKEQIAVLEAQIGAVSSHED